MRPGKLGREMMDMWFPRIRSLRVARKMTQRTAAERLGVSLSTYRAYEKGQHDMDIYHLARLGDLFGVSLDYLTGRSDDPGPPYA